jgi:hypothetical protein
MWISFCRHNIKSTNIFHCLKNCYNVTNLLLNYEENYIRGCNVVGIVWHRFTDVSEEHTATSLGLKRKPFLLSFHDHGGSAFLRTVCKILPDYTASYPKDNNVNSLCRENINFNIHLPSINELILQSDLCSACSVAYSINGAEILLPPVDG